MCESKKLITTIGHRCKRKRADIPSYHSTLENELDEISRPTALLAAKLAAGNSHSASAAAIPEPS